MADNNKAYDILDGTWKEVCRRLLHRINDLDRRVEALERNNEE